MEDISIIGTLVVIAGFIISIYIYFDGKIDKINNRISDTVFEKIDKINNRISDTDNTITAHAAKIENLDKFVGSEEFRKWIAYSYEMETETKEDTGNPISPEEKQRLIEKFENNTIEREEAERLKQILEEEKKEAEATGNTKATISIGLLVAALAHHLEDFLPKNILKLKDEHPDVRRKAAMDLGSIGDARAVKPLISALKDEDGNVRWKAVGALERIGGTKAAEALTKALGDEYEPVRYTAVEALVKIGAEAVEPLKAALKDESPRVREGVASALGEIGDPKANYALRKASKEDIDKKVRSIAKDALKKNQSKTKIKVVGREVRKRLFTYKGL